MARIRTLSRDEAAPEARSAYDRAEAERGYVLNSTGVYAHRPTVQAGLRSLASGIHQSGLIPDRLQKLVDVRVASLIGCPF